MTLYGLTPIRPGRVYRTRQLLAASVPVTLKSSAWTPLYQVAAPVERGDLVSIQGMAQLTNDLGYNVMYGLYVLRSAVPDVAHPSDGFQVVRASATNITPDMHHLPRHAIGTDEAAESGTAYYTFVAYCASTAATPGASCRVDDYGELVVSVTPHGT